jgi:hypothetical protein
MFPEDRRPVNPAFLAVLFALLLSTGFAFAGDEKTIVKAKGVKFLALTFAMPEVQPGSIVEYRYVREFPEGMVSDSRWILRTTCLPNTRHSHCTATTALPRNGVGPRVCHKERNLRRRITTLFGWRRRTFRHSKPRISCPPPEEMKFRVEFQYTVNSEKDPDRFWGTATRIMYSGVSTFIDKKKAMDEAISQMGLANDAPEGKLRKIYARVQQIRNLSYEREKSEQEQNRQKLQPIENVEDVWKKGYGYNRQINWLFLALARSAGFEASPVLAPSRARHFFRPQLMNVDQLTSSVVLVVIDGKTRCLDPGTKFAPFGLLPWAISGVPARRLDKDGGSWFTTEEPPATESRVERKATLHLTDDGSLEGDLTVTYSGLEAMWRRADEIEEDDAGRKKFLEDQVKEYVPVKIEAQLTNTPDWNSAAPTSVAKYEIKIPGWVTSAGPPVVAGRGNFWRVGAEGIRACQSNVSDLFQLSVSEH